MARENAGHGGVQGANEKHGRDDGRRIDAHHLGNFLIVANGARRPAEGGLLQQQPQRGETGHRHRDAKDIERLDVGAGHRPGGVAEGRRQRARRALKDDGDESGNGKQYAQRGDQHHQRRPGPLPHIDIQPPVQRHPHRPRQQAGYAPAQVQPRSRSLRRQPAAPRAQYDRRQDDDGRQSPPLNARRHQQNSPPQQEAGRGRRQRPHGRGGGEMQQRRVVQNYAGIDAGAGGQNPHAGAQNGGGHASAPAGLQDGVEAPGGHAGDQDGKDDVDIDAVDIAGGVENGRRGAEVKNAVGANGGGGPIVKVKEPDGAVHDGKAQGQQGIDGANGQPVEGELQRLHGRLSDFPADIADDGHGKDDGQQLGCRRRHPGHQGRPARGAGALRNQGIPPPQEVTGAVSGWERFRLDE